MTAPMIALLDNDPPFLSAMHDLLTGEGYRTLRCRPDDVLEAHALVRRFQPALVILDRWWQGDDGWDFLKHLWADPRTTHIRVVLTAGEEAPSSSLHSEILRAMRCRLLRTPMDRDGLLRAVEAVLGPPSIGRAPDRRIAAMAACAPVAAVAAARAPDELPGHGLAARAARHGASALDAASDS
jgi:CheY-like chemotaxis protein